MNVDLIIEALSKGFDKLSKDLEAVGKSGEEAGKGAEKGGKQVGFLEANLTKLVAGGVLLKAGKALLDFGQASINAASDVEEMQSKFNTVFKELSGSVTAELETFADAANRSKFDLMGFAATLQDTFVPLGFARDEAADVSVTLVKLAEDLASFNNLNTEDVVRDLQSALVGNTETLRKYGVVAQETQIKQEALATGLWDGEGAISAQAKAQAILQLTLKGTTDAQGDAIKTADSYANTSKGLEAAMTDLKVAIGQGLLPQMTELKQQSTEVISGMAGWITTNHNLQQAVADGVITQTEANRIIDKIALTSYTAADAQEYLAAAYEETNKATDRKNSYLARQAEEEARVAAAIEETKAAQEAETQAIIEYHQAAAAAAGVNEDLADKQLQLANHTGTEEQAAKAANLANEQYFRTLEEESKAADEAAAAQARLKQATADYFQQAINADGAVGLYNETAAQMADRTIYVSNLTNDQREALGELQDEYDKARDTLNDYEMGVKGVGLTEEERATKIAEQRDRMAELEAAMSPLVDLGGEYANVQGTMTINEDALNQSIYDSAAAAGASAEQLAILGGALGLFSDEAVEAALKTAAIQIKIDEMAQAYVDGKISVDEMRQGVQDFIASLNAVPDAVTTDVSVTSVDEAINKVGSLQAQLNALGGQISEAEAAGAVQKPGGGVGLAGGADFVVPPGYPNDSFGPIYVQSGERVQVTPAGQSGAMGGGFSVNGPLIGAVYQRPGENGTAFADRVSTMVAQKIGELK